jgi:hypothetical protein
MTFAARPSRPLIALCVCAALAAVSRLAADEAPSFAPIAAYLKQHCVACHGESEPKAGLSLTKLRAADDLIAQHALWESVVTMVEAGEMPPAERPRPAVEQTAALLTAGKAILADYERRSPPNPGRVTMRRLNKAEYDNTIRDLFYGLDIRAAADFPADDVGHGFDNIGDVLSMSPLLMDRYLAAAEEIAGLVIVPNIPKPTARGFSIQYTQPSSPNVPLSGSFRVVTAKPEATIVETGPLYAQFAMSPVDEYIFRFGCYAETKDDPPVRVAAFVHGKELTDASSDEEIANLYGLAVERLKPLRILGTFEVSSREAKSSQNFEARIPAMPGITHVGVALVKPVSEEPETKLFVKYFTMDGPLDMRPYAMRRLMECSPEKSHAEQTCEIVERFARRAFRRPPTAEELARLVKIVESTEAEGERWEAGLQLAIAAVLASPKFVFRAELDEANQTPVADARGSLPLDEFQLASRLSYFLWSSMPDDELFALAADGKLSANLEGQVRRMLADPKSRSLVEQFAMQWLQLGRLRTHAPDSTLFPTFNETLRQSMLKETQLFIDAIIREDRGIADLLDADFTFLNRSLAAHYGIADTAGSLRTQKKRNPGGRPFRADNIWERVPLTDGVRGGLLTQASILTVSSNPTRTSPVKRGKWVLEQILGAPPPPPPADVPELEAQKDKLTGTLRERMEQHRANPACANCHAKMDPLGFAFEQFDAIGAFRTTDGDAPIDVSGTLPGGKTFNGPAELRAILKERKEEFARCLTEKLLTFALGRGLEFSDRRAVDKIMTALAADDYKFSTLCVEIARSDPFRKRRGEP